ncbi:hypothetical protein C8T65DRAFT_776673 [Cerioporus squamosus]|nr:hypothetical protein C8T65DRAFT_776673 [Cerioporus squamosus]
MAFINYLPNELLVQIFLTVRDTVDQEEDGMRKMRWLRLTEVCHRWAEVIRSTPAMWTVLHFYSNADSGILATFLGRSCELTGLEVSLDFGRSGSPPSWAQAVHGSPHVRRISILTIRWHRTQNEDVYLFIGELQADSLTTLTLFEDDSELVTPTDETTTDEEGGYGYEGQVVAGIVLRSDHGGSSSGWESGSEQEDAKHGAAWGEDAFNEGYDGSEENSAEEEDDESDEEYSESEDSEDEVAVNDNHWQPRVPDSDTDEAEEEEIDESSEENQLQSPGANDDEVSGDELNGMAVLQIGQPTEDNDEGDAFTDDGEGPFALRDLLLPHLPALISLSLSGLLLVDILPATKANLRSLAIFDTGKYGAPPLLPHDGVLDILDDCTNLEQLMLDDVCWPESSPDERRVSLPNLQRLVFVDGQYVTQAFLPFLELGKCVSLHLEGLLDWRDWSGETKPSGEAPPTVFKDALPALSDFSSETQPIFEAILKPTALMFHADNGFFVSGRSQYVDGAYIDWHVGADASDDLDSDTRQYFAMERYRALPAAIEEFSTRAPWRTDTVTDLELHFAPCHEFIHRLLYPSIYVDGFMDTINAFEHLRRFVVGGEFAARLYLTGLHSAEKGLKGLEELGFCLLAPSDKCFTQLMRHFKDSAELPRRLVVRLPQTAFDPRPEVAAHAHRGIDFREVGYRYPTVEVSLIAHDCATCQRAPVHMGRSVSPLLLL